MTQPIDGLGPLRLPEVLDARAAPGLMQMLCDRRGRDLALDGSLVRRLGGQCLQILLSAESTWRADRRALVIVTPSADLITGLAVLGVGPDSPLLQGEGVA